MHRQPGCTSVRESVDERNNITELVGNPSSPHTKGVAGQHKLVATPQCSTQIAQYVEENAIDSPTHLNKWGPPV